MLSHERHSLVLTVPSTFALNEFSSLFDRSCLAGFGCCDIFFPVQKSCEIKRIRLKVAVYKIICTHACVFDVRYLHKGSKFSTLVIMRIPKNCSLHCISKLPISHDLAHCLENVRFGENPKTMKVISEA